MKNLGLYLILLIIQLPVSAQNLAAEDYYMTAFNEMSNMLDDKGPLSIKRAVFIAEWAYYEGQLDYKTDFCDEIDRITEFINRFYTINKLSLYKTGKQMALNEYFMRPYSGNNYNPYTYDFENFSVDTEFWEDQFVSKVLKTHKGQCRSLPWMYKILANEIGANVSIAHAPRHSYIMYKDDDSLTPEDWINLELTTHQLQPAFWIKHDFEICDSAVLVGTYMTPMTDKQTVACQMADLALGYREKFNRYDEFTYSCARKSLESNPFNPNAYIIQGKSLENILQKHFASNGNIVDDYAAHLLYLIDITKVMLDKTYMTVETEELRTRRSEKAADAKIYMQEKLMSK